MWFTLLDEKMVVISHEPASVCLQFCTCQLWSAVGFWESICENHANPEGRRGVPRAELCWECAWRGA